MNDTFKAYRYIALNGTEKNIISETYTKKGIASLDYFNSSINTWISVLSGCLVVPSNGSYVFSATADTQGIFYLSEEELTGNPDLIVIHSYCYLNCFEINSERKVHRFI